MKKIIIYILLIITLYLIYIYNNFENKIIIKQQQIITINKWENLKILSKKLNINYYLLQHYIHNNNKNFKLLAWKFKIEKNSTITNIIKSLEKPLAEQQVNITILEWWNIFDIDRYLTNKWFINKWDYIKYVENHEKIKSLSKFYKFLNPAFITLEWFLYPDSYKIKYPVQINKLVIKQLDNFEQKVYNKILLNKNTLDILKIINLASIVEKEEKTNSEKPTVAGILKKRLENNWNIWADITVCYPHKLTANECKMVISKYINEKSEYNTRTMTGLPKTPIWNPSFETIYSTLYYKKTQYWYYLHNIKTWKIYYWKTNIDHKNNKKYMFK